METKRIKISDTKNINDEELKEAAQILRDGGLVAFPTETVYGLGSGHGALAGETWWKFWSSFAL